MHRDLQKIIKGCINNNRKAQFDLYHLCYERLMRTCQRYKRNTEDAKALLNEGFLKILLNLKSYDPRQEFFPWASTVMVRTAIDEYRKTRTYTEGTDLKDNDQDLEEVSLEDGHLRVVEQLSAEDIREMILSLPEDERMVFNLYEGEGYQHHEIAERMEVSERTTKRYLKAAKMKLRKMIEKRKDLKKVV